MQGWDWIRVPPNATIKRLAGKKEKGDREGKESKKNCKLQGQNPKGMDCYPM